MKERSKLIQKWVDTYKHLELDDEAIKIFNDVYVKEYSNDIDQFRASYFQTCVDIKLNQLRVGDRIYYVFGSSLSEGIIESFEPFKVGYTYPRIKIEGKKKAVWSYQTVKG